MQVVTLEQFFDGGMDVWPELSGLLAAPGWRPLKERGLLRRVVIPIGLALPGAAATSTLLSPRASRGGGCHAAGMLAGKLATNGCTLAADVLPLVACREVGTHDADDRVADRA
jgi:hypothetical protein